MRLARSISPALALLVTLVPISAFAKGVTIGIYGIVDQVTFEPDEASPRSIRISGVFVVPVRLSSGDYRAPQRGYLRFQIRPGEEEAVRKDWNEIRKLAGTGQVVGFGQYWMLDPSDPSGSLHRSLEVTVHPDDKNGEPETYPLPNIKGVVTRGDKDDPKFKKIAAQLRAAYDR
jgi:hypothetical protein